MTRAWLSSGRWAPTNDHTCESTADDTLTFACSYLIKGTAKVRCGVVVEGADVTSAYSLS